MSSECREDLVTVNGGTLRLFSIACRNEISCEEVERGGRGGGEDLARRLKEEEEKEMEGKETGDF